MIITFWIAYTEVTRCFGQFQRDVRNLWNVSSKRVPTAPADPARRFDDGVLRLNDRVKKMVAWRTAGGHYNVDVNDICLLHDN